MRADRPGVSVVAGTYNDAGRLAASIDSVLAQDFPDFELIIVNDGSPDPRTGAILADYARRDARIRVITRKNEGLTRALIAGCAEARGGCIARLDIGDRYLPGKLSRQMALIEAEPAVALVSCGVRHVYEDGTVIREEVVVESPERATSRLRADQWAELRGICAHGTALFRRADYERAGGYRPEFYFAQDIDLWLRLTDGGSVAFLPEVLYEVDVSADGLSGMNYTAQQRLGKIAVALRQARQQGKPEADLLALAGKVRPHGSRMAWSSRRSCSAGQYFLGNLLYHLGHGGCHRHFRQAVALNPLNLRAWVLWGCSVLYTRAGLPGRKERRGE